MHPLPPVLFPPCPTPIPTRRAWLQEHSIANMFLVPLGIALGAPVTFGHFVTSNLIPVTLGNIVGGMCCVGLASAYVYGSLGQPKAA